MEHNWSMGFRWIRLGICKCLDDFRGSKWRHDHMGLDYNMDSHNAHFDMFDQMDSRHLCNNQLVELRLDISVLKWVKTNALIIMIIPYYNII